MKLGRHLWMFLAGALLCNTHVPGQMASWQEALEAALAANLLTNGDFATSTAGWSHDPDVVFSTDDASGSPSSGSMEIRNSDDSPIGDESATQCVALGAGSYNFSSRYKLLGTSPPGTANFELRLYSLPNCPDGAVVNNLVLATGSLREIWATASAQNVVVPAGVQSARVKLETLKTGSGTLIGRFDDVLLEPSGGGGGGTCTPSATTLCLRGGRFRVTANWVIPSGAQGQGFAVPMTSDTGYFWFFTAANVEVVVKVLDGCGFNQRYWVYAGGLTDLDVTLRVEDLARGAGVTYRNPQGQPFRTINDSSALATCP